MIIFTISALHALYFIKQFFFNAGLSFTPEVLILCKKVWRPRELGVETLTFDITVFRRTNNNTVIQRRK